MSHKARSTFSSKVGSTTCNCSPATEETVSRRSSVDTLSLHFVGAIDGLAEVSKLERGGGDTGFEGADGGEVPNVEDPVLDDISLPEGVDEIDGRGC